jgi:hypothetical protein
MSGKILYGSFIKSGSGFENSHMDDKMAASWPIQFREGTRHGIRRKKIWSPRTIKRKTESI